MHHYHSVCTVKVDGFSAAFQPDNEVPLKRDIHPLSLLAFMLPEHDAKMERKQKTMSCFMRNLPGVNIKIKGRLGL